jgi:hypothetical protein
MAFQINFDAYGDVKNYKTWLVAKDFTQIPSIYYIDKFSHVVKIDSIHVVLTLTTQYNLEVHQLDVKTTFLNGIICI